VAAHTLDASLVIALGLTVRLVLLRRRKTQVLPSVVRSIPVDVINLSVWPSPGHERERDAVSVIMRVLEADQ
jgi:hypothetical protein